MATTENNTAAKDWIKELQTLKEQGHFNELLKRIRDSKHVLESTSLKLKDLREQLKEDLTQESLEEPEQAIVEETETVEVSTPEAEVIEPAEKAPQQIIKPEEKKEIPKKESASEVPDYIVRQATRTRQFDDTKGRDTRQFTPRTDASRPRPGDFRPKATPSRDIAVTIPAPAVTPFKDKDKDKEKGKVHEKKEPRDAKKTINKRTLIRRGIIDEFDEERQVFRKAKSKKAKKQEIEVRKIDRAVITTENLTVKLLSEKIGIPAKEIIKQLMQLGIMTTINSTVDFPTMELVADSLGVKLELKLEKTKEEILEEFYDENDDPKDLELRPPIVTVMGHVDHGKTSLLDCIRKTSVTSTEAGGITQHIGAYTVTLEGRKITFIDTPGHEAFTELRARGAKVTDIAIIVVAADDGVMPQTIEAINHAKAANVPIVVAVNKIDKADANTQRILEQLATHDVVCEAWGGDSPVVEVSAKLGKNIDKLLQAILDLSDIYEFKANPNRKAKGIVIESKLDKGRGPVATVIIQNGTLQAGDVVLSGTTWGSVRALTDDKGRLVKKAGPSMPVMIQGFQDVPNAGDVVYAVENEKMARQVAEERADKIKARQSGATSAAVSLEDMFAKIGEGQVSDFNIIIKGDVQGSIEALKTSLEKLSNEEIRVKIIHTAVGAINKSDVMLAEASKGVIVGFNVRPDAETKNLAEQSGVDIRTYRIIYEAIDEIGAAVKGLLKPKFQEQIIGHAEVRNIFNITGAGIVAGCYITDGKITRAANARILRNKESVFDGKIGSIKRLKDDVKEVASGFECGITVQNFEKFEVGDIIEAYLMEKVQ